MVAFPGFRYFIIVIVIIAGIGIYILIENEEKEDKLSRQRIAISELEFKDVSLKGSGYGSYTMSGRIINKSKTYTLSNVGLNLKVYDCKEKSDQKDCIIIGEKSDSIYIAIPPKQARDFEERIYFSGDELKPKGKMIWEYEITYTKAAK
ncbi:hypothetical protein ACFL5W_01640 [Thermodesulfobacteriota bacterium]